jgi:hypothetical protein
MPKMPALPLAALALTLSLGGCVIAPLGPAAGADEGDGPVVEVAPPPPRDELRPLAPGPGYIWIGGNWAWQLGRHVWIGGRWTLPPAGRVWVPGQWNHRGHGWRWHPGYWGRR